MAEINILQHTDPILIILNLCPLNLWMIMNFYSLLMQSGGKKLIYKRTQQPSTKSRQEVQFSSFFKIKLCYHVL